MFVTRYLFQAPREAPTPGTVSINKYGHHQTGLQVQGLKRIQDYQNQFSRKEER
jgi:hypothetical protein